MSVRTRKAIVRWLRGRNADPLVISPLLTDEQIGDSSVDVRLGNEFLILTRTQAAAFDYRVERLGTKAGHATFRRTRREFGEPLFLHPHQLVLGATLEFVRLPRSLMAYVIGKSSLGRTGLVIATATAVAPGFGGCVTLEIVNLGEVPLPLYPGMRIAQLVFHSVEGTAEYKGRYSCSVGPEPPFLERDGEMAIWASEKTTMDSKPAELASGNDEKAA